VFGRRELHRLSQLLSLQKLLEEWRRVLGLPSRGLHAQAIQAEEAEQAETEAPALGSRYNSWYAMLTALLFAVLSHRQDPEPDPLYKMYRLSVGQTFQIGTLPYDGIHGATYPLVGKDTSLATFQAEQLDQEEDLRAADAAGEDTASAEANLLNIYESVKATDNYVIHRGAWAKVLEVQDLSPNHAHFLKYTRQLQKFTITTGDWKGKTYWMCRDFDLRWPPVLGDMAFSFDVQPVAFDLINLKTYQEAKGNNDTTMMRGLEKLDRVFLLKKDQIVQVIDRSGTYVRILICSGPLKDRKGWADEKGISTLTTADQLNGVR
jgi:hypothetical protein